MSFWFWGRKRWVAHHLRPPVVNDQMRAMSLLWASTSPVPGWQQCYTAKCIILVFSGHLRHRCVM